MGTTRTRVVVAEFIKGEKNPKIIGVGESQTMGVRHGYIINVPEASTSLKNALASAEKSSGTRIKRACIAIDSSTLRGVIGVGSVIISKADGEVTELDIRKVIEEGENNLRLNNKKVLKAFPLSYKLDGKEIIERPEGLRGAKLEAKILYITCSLQHFEDLIEVITLCGVEPTDIIPSALAGSAIALSEKQKIVGSALVDIGSETVSLAVFENGSLVHLHTFALGSEDITNDIALGLRISLEKAESLKTGNFPSGQSASAAEYPKKKLDDIIEARLIDIFELIENHLKKIKRNELLPAGIVFTGGGSNTPRLEELSKSTLKLPSRVGTTDMFENVKTKLRDPSWFTVLGLLMPSDDDENYESDSLRGMFVNLKKTLKTSLKQLMP